MIKVLFCSLKYDYGNPSRGYSFEYENLLGTLEEMSNVEVTFFPFDERMCEVGREVMNEELKQVVLEQKPDLLFCFLYQDEIKKEVIEFITNKTATKTFNWFADDHWRVPVYSRYWASLFTKISTTHSEAVDKYAALGIKNVIHTQWAANVNVYKPQRTEHEYGVTFVGQKVGPREKFVKKLAGLGLGVETFGNGWGNGKVTLPHMLDIFSNSKINLNFVQIPFMNRGNILKPLARLVVKKENGKIRLDLKNVSRNLDSLFSRRTPMIKGRNFEVPACGGFVLSGNADNLRDYYEPNKEIVIFESLSDLVEKCNYYLENESERKKIAQAGLERTLREHTYEHRIKDIFTQLELE